MLNILTKGYLDILRLFYTEKTSLHLRAIAKKTKLNENSAYRFLNKLENEKILQSEKQGNMKVFSLKKSKLVYSTLLLFDIERYEKLSHIRKTAITYYLNALPQQPVFVILFGSTAKNNYKNSSDIDILIITNERIKTKKAESEADAQSALKVSTFQMNYEQFLTELKLKEDKVVQSAIKTGYPLTNHIKYYEVIQDANL